MMFCNYLGVVFALGRFVEIDPIWGWLDEPDKVIGLGWW